MRAPLGRRPSGVNRYSTLPWSDCINKQTRRPRSCVTEPSRQTAQPPDSALAGKCIGCHHDLRRTHEVSPHRSRERPVLPRPGWLSSAAPRVPALPPVPRSRPLRLVQQPVMALPRGQPSPRVRLRSASACRVRVPFRPPQLGATAPHGHGHVLRLRLHAGIRGLVLPSVNLSVCGDDWLDIGASPGAQQGPRRER